MAHAPNPALIPFRNEPYLDFSTPSNRAAMQLALADVRTSLGREYALLIGGQRIPPAQTGNTIVSTNPARPDEVVGIHASATPDLARDRLGKKPFYYYW